MRMLRTLGLAAAFAGGLTAAASAATVGNDVIDRATVDTWSDFSFAFTNDTFIDGTITDWSVFAGGAGDIALLVLDQVAPNTFEVAAVEVQNVAAGLNNFMTSIAVSAGQILGLYQGSGKVDFDFVSGPNDEIFGARDGFPTAPTVGASFSGVGSTARDYSISVEVSPVPLPAGLPLLVFGLGALAVARRQKA
ncbi:MAG: VPLPA-CTERM sorting domain-containing protein [Pseudomonadota bacterium]